MKDFMGTIKIELDIPNFEKELEIKVMLNKDGVQQCAPSMVNTQVKTINYPDNSDGSSTIWRDHIQSSVFTLDSSRNPNQTVTVTNTGIPKTVTNTPSDIPNSMIKNY